MREALFVKQNSEKWKEYESLHTSEPDLLAERFIAITDDLAYSKTFYPRSKTTTYLNGLASKIHQSIYKNKREKSSRFVTFWKTELPMLFAIHRKKIFYSFVFFVVFCFVGVISARYDNRFIRLVLGNEYVNMTNENIAKGDPFGVYKHQNEFLMFVMIAANNIRVAFYIFVSGIFLSAGTIYTLIYNGVMVGSFEYYFFSKGLGLQSVLVISIHGTLEISAIIIAGSAGLVLGNSILFPGTYPRMLSLKKGAREGLKIVIGLVPIFICAAFLEGFITRHTEMPVLLSVSILLLSLAFIIWYVVIYPMRLERMLRKQSESERKQY